MCTSWTLFPGTGFAWVDGTDLDYTNWLPEEPSSSSEECTEVLFSPYAGAWNDLYCTGDYLNAVCKMPACKLLQTIIIDFSLITKLYFRDFPSPRLNFLSLLFITPLWDHCCHCFGFWWHLPWASKLVWIPSLVCCITCTLSIPQIHLWWHNRWSGARVMADPFTHSATYFLFRNFRLFVWEDCSYKTLCLQLNLLLFLLVLPLFLVSVQKTGLTTEVFVTTLNRICVWPGSKEKHIVRWDTQCWEGQV